MGFLDRLPSWPSELRADLRLRVNRSGFKVFDEFYICHFGNRVPERVIRCLGGRPVRLVIGQGWWF